MKKFQHLLQNCGCHLNGGTFEEVLGRIHARKINIYYHLFPVPSTYVAICKVMKACLSWTTYMII